MRFGTWNVTNMYGAGSLREVAEEISKYKLNLVGVQVRWDRNGTEPASEHIVTKCLKAGIESLPWQRREAFPL
jgi:hypothetical protein